MARCMILILFVVISIAPTLDMVSASTGALTRKDLASHLARKEMIPITAETPKATPWPEEFTIEFTTDDGLASGFLAYDWGNKQQAIVHGGGSSHCLARGSKKLCYILENPTGTFEVDPVSERCELTVAGVGSVPPSWVVQGVFVGVEEVNGVKCNRFNYPPTMHAWLETVDGSLPCAFLFPNPLLTYVFNPTSLKLGKPASNMFTVPDYCPKKTSGELYTPTLKANQ